ncbi:hypothetical protein E3G56_005336 [Mycobacteroides abscessus]|nr:hypothetical protein [Mycobacteroides abscessus]
MTYVGTLAYSQQIITPEMRTFGTEALEAQAAALRTEAAARERQANTRATQNALREEAVKSRGSENMHMEQRYAVVDIRHHADAAVGSAKFLENMATLMRNVDAKQAEIDREAHEKIGTAKTLVEIEALIAEYHGWAEGFSLSASREIATMTARWESAHSATYSGVAARSAAAMGQAPVNPPAPNPSPGIVKPLDEKTKKHQKDGSSDSGRPEQPTSENPANRETPAQDSQSKVQDGHTRSAALGGERGEVLAVTPQGPSRSAAPSPLSGGGVPSSGGSSGGGLGSGLGSNPLSSALGGGLGQSPAGGLGSGLSSTNPAAAASNSGSAVNPGAAFARGFSSASSAVPPPVSSAPPAAGTGSAPPVAGPALAPAVSGAASGGPVAAAGAHGMVTPATAAGGAGGPTSSFPLLPSPGMGAPAAAGATAAVAPAGSAATTAAAAGSSSTGAAGNVGPTLVPAAVVSAVDPDRAVRGLSPDAKAAALLAWRLWHDCREVGLPVNWAVGVFRSSEGTETVVHSTEGSGYVPANVHIPRGVRLLVADDLVDSDFRKKWFGWADPIDVLAEYAAVRQAQGWHLVAAAVVGVAGNRQALDRQVEFVACSIDDSPHKPGDPVAALDQMHVHRLQGRRVRQERERDRLLQDEKDAVAA